MSVQREDAVTVIICNYNYGRFIRACLESLAAQTHPPFGLVIVDDASTDDSVRVIGDFLAAPGHPFAEHRLIAKECNGGKLSCLNRAVGHVSTPYTLIVDSDDTLAPDTIERLLGALLAARREDPSVGFVYSDSHLVDACGATVGHGRSAPWSRELLRTHSYIPECALTVSPALCDAAPFDESIRVGTKHHKWNRIADAGWTGVHIPEPLFNYRMHDGNLSGIGKTVLNEDSHDPRRERLLAGYWPTARS